MEIEQDLSLPLQQLQQRCEAILLEELALVMQPMNMNALWALAEGLAARISDSEAQYIIDNADSLYAKYVGIAAGLGSAEMPNPTLVFDNFWKRFTGALEFKW